MQMPLPVKAPVRSMTGFALVRRATSAGELTVSLRSVNHRGLDLHFHVASDLAVFENAIRAALKRGIGRGHVEIRMSLNRESSGQSAAYNREAIARYVAAFRQAAADHGLAQQPDLNAIFAQAGILEETSGLNGPDSALEPEVLAALEECIAELNAHRDREGSALTGEFLKEAAAIEAGASEISAIRHTALPQFHERLRERLSELLGQSNMSESRLAEEAAIQADRSDIQEELTRLGVHSGELRRILGEGGEMGKRLDFLLQEMNRETNTILSKTSGIGDTGLTVTARALEIKSHVEKIREQALNIE
jgi:uncharacterized protein (TIGR00255 family)